MKTWILVVLGTALLIAATVVQGTSLAVYFDQSPSTILGTTLPASAPLWVVGLACIIVSFLRRRD